MVCFSMTLAHQRKKDPTQVRRQLLEQAARLSLQEGLANMSLQGIATAAGVTKGGLLHHFPSKQALVEAMFTDFLAMLDREIDEQIAADDQTHGCFSRAYVEAMFRQGDSGMNSPCAVLGIAMLTDPGLRDLWAKWLAVRLERHRQTDGAPELEVIRYAADGVWLADFMEARPANRADLRNRLISATKRVSS
ncbi:TetR/AcrR family transcriptional regulator [Nordella sp. HKS 07]|nr:TetR/AcrR family transcriptional regulator [Nordella sp. HKS 07]